MGFSLKNFFFCKAIIFLVKTVLKPIINLIFLHRNSVFWFNKLSTVFFAACSHQ